MVIPAGRYASYHQRVRTELDNALVKLDRDDPGWRLEDVERGRATVPDGKNSALVVKEANRWLPSGWFVPESMYNHINDTAPQERLDSDDSACLRNELSELQTALIEARKLADLPAGRHSITYTRGFVGTLLPDAQNTRTIFSLLQLDVIEQAEDGDLKGAIRSCKAVLNATRSLGDEPLIISQLIRMAGVGVAYCTIQRVLNQGEADAEDLLALQNLLQEEARFPRLLVALRGERAGMHELLDALEAGDMSISSVVDLTSNNVQLKRPSKLQEVLAVTARDSIREQHPQFLAMSTEAIRIAALPPQQRAAAFADLTEAYKGNLANPVRALIPAYEKIDQAARRTDCQLQCLITALALERFRQHNHRWPDTLAQLVPDYLSAVPLDPEDGEPLRFQRREDRVVLYSLHLKSGKNSLAPYDPVKLSPPGIGVAVHLFDVQRRRQPPRPKPQVAQRARGMPIDEK
jgi:hypothetical protein